MPSSTGAGPIPLPLVRRGKVRDMYAIGDDLLLMVASDRVSAFDVVMDDPIPGKGAVLTDLSQFWFGQMGDVTPHHLVSSRFEDFPPHLRPWRAELEGRSLLVHRAQRIDVECVVRGYLAGSGWAEFHTRQTLAEEPLPPGLEESARLPTPRFTPAIKADSGHDQNISRASLRDLLGAALADTLERTSLNIYRKAESYASEKGLILADTKFEFGLLHGEVVLIDELLTPDSSRYWPASGYAPGRPQPSFDKQFLRDWLEQSGWNKEPPPPRLPPVVIEATRARYAEARSRLLSGAKPRGCSAP